MRTEHLVRMERLELSRVAPLEPKSSASTNFATFAHKICLDYTPFTADLPARPVFPKFDPSIGRNLSIIKRAHIFSSVRNALPVLQPTLSRPATAIDLEMNDLNRQQDKEGVVKYRLDYTAAPSLNPGIVAELNAWRTILYRLGLTGQDPRRYDGLAYGNVSIRRGLTAFLISGTQTGGLPELSSEHYSLVTGFNPERNWVAAEGPIPPSSEALTHAAVYRSGGGIDCVLHVHSPEIWEKAEALAIPVTDRQVAYGTPEMAREVEYLVRTSRSPVIAMGGHEDGIVAYGGTVEEAAASLIRSLARALAQGHGNFMASPV